MAGCVRWQVESDGRFGQMAGCVRWQVMWDCAGCVRWQVVSDGRLCQMAGCVRWQVVSDGRLSDGRPITGYENFPQNDKVCTFIQIIVGNKLEWMILNTYAALVQGLCMQQHEIITQREWEQPLCPNSDLYYYFAGVNNLK